MSQPSAFVESIERMLRHGDPDWDAVLAAALAHFDCPLGTVHLRDDHGLLQLKAHRGLPPPVLEKVATIPVGKGMAGIAAERREPVQICNLQSDDSGVVRPGAKMTRMEGSIAAPMMHGDEVLGVLGVAKPVEFEFSEEQASELMAAGRLLAAHCAG
jgi:L-methionine (R)-S-oxide reductase